MDVLSVVIPCYNEEAVVDESYRQLSEAVRSIEGIDYELIFVNDGSQDRTAEKLAVLLERDPHVRVVEFSRNFGHEAAITAGMAYATGTLIGVIDADLQDPPEALVGMTREVITNPQLDVAFGVRADRSSDSIFKRVTARAFYRVFSALTGNQIPQDAGNFRVMRRPVVDAFLSHAERNRYSRGLLSMVGFRQEPYPFERHERFAGETKYPLSRMLGLAFNAIFSFSVAPLKAITWTGFLSILISLGLLVYVVIGWIQGAERGWASMISVVIFFGGVQLFSLGILGEYLGRIFVEVKQRPIYIVRGAYGFART